MAYNILGVNTGYHGSVCVLSNGEIVFYLEEERLSKTKKDPYPFKNIIYAISKYNIDEVVLAGSNDLSDVLRFTGEELFSIFFRKFLPNCKITYIYDNHHLCHASNSFFNSPFKEAISLVIDGQGSRKKYIINNKELEGDETESIFNFSYLTYPKKIYGSYLNLSQPPYSDENITFSNNISIGKSYEAITKYLKWHPNEGGKTMGLSSYGNPKNLIPNIFTIPNIFQPTSYYPSFQNYDFNPSFLDSSLINDKDISYRIQHDTYSLVKQYVKKIIKTTNIKQICCSGGYFLNCVNNYLLVKDFPNIKFYFDPIAHDGGLAIGAAKLIWYKKTQDKTIRLQKLLYLGPKYSQEELLEGIKKYVG